MEKKLKLEYKEKKYEDADWDQIEQMKYEDLWKF